MHYVAKSKLDIMLVISIIMLVKSMAPSIMVKNLTLKPDCLCSNPRSAL